MDRELSINVWLEKKNVLENRDISSFLETFVDTSLSCRLTDDLFSHVAKVDGYLCAGV